MVRSSEKTVHERVVDCLVDRMSCDGYYSVGSNIFFTNLKYEKCPDGEFDVRGLKGDFEGKGRRYAVIVEVKQSDRSGNRRKAASQLEKCERAIKDEYGERVRVFKIYAFSDKSLRENRPEKPYQLRWIR
jgi:hypothetical protein